VVLVLMILLPWMLQLLLNFTVTLFTQIPNYVR
jgi:flagellar biosynthesis protein FliQ